jgi:hypothetical protein
MNFINVNDKGIDNKYFEWKEIFINSLLKPVYSIKDSSFTITVYEALTFKNISDELKINQMALKKIDANFNGFIEQKLAYMVQFLRTDDIENIINDGYSPTQIFIVFKDEILNGKPSTSFFSFNNIDYKEFIQQKLN